MEEFMKIEESRISRYFGISVFWHCLLIGLFFSLKEGSVKEFESLKLG